MSIIERIKALKGYQTGEPMTVQEMSLKTRIDVSEIAGVMSCMVERNLLYRVGERHTRQGVRMYYAKPMRNRLLSRKWVNWHPEIPAGPPEWNLA